MKKDLYYQIKDGGTVVTAVASVEPVIEPVTEITVRNVNPVIYIKEEKNNTSIKENSLNLASENIGNNNGPNDPKLPSPNNNKIMELFKKILIQNSNSIIIPIMLSIWGLTYFMYEYQVFDYFINNFFKKPNLNNSLLKQNTIINSISEHIVTENNNVSKYNNKINYIIFGVIFSSVIIIINIFK